MPTIFDLHLEVEESHWAVFLQKEVFAIGNDHDGYALEVCFNLELLDVRNGGNFVPGAHDDGHPFHRRAPRLG